MKRGDNRANLIEQYTKKALSAFEDASILAAHSRWNACINRLYYACFYIVYALLLQKEDVRIKTHTGIKTLFNKHVVKPGLVSNDCGRFYSFIMEKRGETDYEDFGTATEDEVKALMLETESFINTIKKLIE